MTDYIAYAYAITVAVGGIVGYIKKGSMMSAIMVSSINFHSMRFKKFNLQIKRFSGVASAK